MDHVAIDLGTKKSQVCVRSSDGKIVEERRMDTLRLKEFLAKKTKCRVIVETCAEAFAVADTALGLGHEARVVPATLVRTLGVGSRRTKTDRRDAQTLSEVSCRIELPSVHIPSEEARRRKTLCGMREALVGTRTKLINTVRGWLRCQGIHLRTGRSTTFPDRVRAMVGNGLPNHAVRQLNAIDALSVEIAGADEEIAQEAQRDELCQRLMSVPGIGAIVAIRFAAALDGVARFADAHRVESYLGLVPGENSSSERQQRLSITKAGPAGVRWALVQAAWSLRRCKKAGAIPLKVWAERIEQRRGKSIATVALARKLAGILYAIWRDGTTYDGALSAKVA